MTSLALTLEMERRGFRLSLAADQGSHPGKPHRAALSITVRRSRGERYDGANCPFCHGPLFEAPQCVGRSVSDAEPHQMYVLDPLPQENVAVVCMACEFAFFSVAGSDAGLESRGGRHRMNEIERIRELERDVAKLTRALGTLMAWMVASANSPLRHDEVEQLLKMLPECFEQ